MGVPGRDLEPGEPLATATRELTEETGYQAGRSAAWPLHLAGIERDGMFEATGLVAGPQQLEAHEEIEVQA